MPQVVVTRGAQITLSKEVRDRLGIREGDVVTVNTFGDVAVISKRDPAVWREVSDFLPERFEKVLADLRGDARERHKRLGLT